MAGSHGYDPRHDSTFRVDDQGAALDSARRPARAAPRRVDAGGPPRPRHLPLPRLGCDRVPAEPARARPPADAAAAWGRRLPRLPPLRRRRHLHRARPRERCRRPGPLRDRPHRRIRDRADGGGKTGAEQDIDRLQHWLDTHGLERVQIEKQATDWVDNLGAGESRPTRRTPSGPPRYAVVELSAMF